MSRSGRVLVGPVVLAVALLQPGEAAAEVARRAVAFEFGIAVNGVTDDAYIDEDGVAIDLDPLVGLHLAVLYRIIPYLSVGLLVHYGFILPDGDNLDTQYSDFLGIIPEIRGHYVFGRIEPWLGFGIGYAFAHTYAEGEIPFFFWTAQAEGDIQLHGVGFGLGTGVHIYLTDSFSLSPYFRMIFGAWPTACYHWETGNNEDDDCDDLDEIYANEPDDLPHLWITGIVAQKVF